MGLRTGRARISYRELFRGSDERRAVGEARVISGTFGDRERTAHKHGFGEGKNGGR